MYNEISTEFKPLFDKTKMDFQSAYNKVIFSKNVVAQNDPSIKKQLVKNILSEVLAEYARTESKRKSGTWLRRIASVISKILKL